MKIENDKLIVYCGEDLVSTIEGTEGLQLDEVDFAVYIYKYTNKPVTIHKREMKRIATGKYEFILPGEKTSRMRTKDLGDYYIELFVDDMTRSITREYAFTMADSSSKQESL